MKITIVIDFECKFFSVHSISLPDLALLLEGFNSLMGYLLIHLLSLPHPHLLPRLLVHRVIIQTREDLSISLGSDCNHIWLLTLGLRII